MATTAPTSGWSSSLAVPPGSAYGFVVTPAAGGTVVLQSSADNTNWTTFANSPFATAGTGKIPPGGIYVRAMSFGAAGTFDVIPAYNDTFSQLTQPQTTQVLNAIAPRLGSLPYIISGLQLPGLTGIAGPLTLQNIIGGGDAVINGVRVTMPATPVTFPASSDTYVDLTVNGTYVLSSVANGTSSGAGIFQAPDSVRVGKVVTGATAVTSGSTLMSGKDFNGVWMGNYAEVPTCILNGGNIQNYTTAAPVVFVVGELAYDNAQMWTSGVSTSRVTVPYPGIYDVIGWVYNNGATTDIQASIYKNGAAYSGGGFRVAASNVYYAGGTLEVVCAANDYIELYVQHGGAGSQLAGASLSVIKRR